MQRAGAVGDHAKVGIGRGETVVRVVGGAAQFNIHRVLRNARHHADRQCGAAAQDRTGGIEHGARVGAGLFQAQVVQRQHRAGAAANGVAVEEPLIAQRANPGGHHAERSAEGFAAHGVGWLSHNHRKRGSGQERSARRLGRAAPVGQVVAVGTGVDSAQGSSEAIYQVGGPRRAVLIFDFIDQDVRHNPR